MRILPISLLALGLMVTPAATQQQNGEEDGGGFLERQIENRLSGPGFQVDVQGFEGALSSRARLGALIISDDQGPWLILRNAVLDWNRSALLRGRVEVTELSAESLEVPRKPVPDDSMTPPAAEAQPFSLPDLPVSVNIEQLAIDSVELGEPLFGEAATVSLDGSASLAGGGGDVDIQVRRIDEEQGEIALAASYDPDNQRLAVDLSLQEGSGGIVGTLIDLPGQPPLSAAITGEGPLSDFTAEINLATDGEPRIAGTVSISGEENARQFAVDIGGDIAPVFTPTYRPFFGPDVQLALTGRQLDGGGFRLDDIALSARSLNLTGEASVGADGLPDLIAVTGEIAGDEDDTVLLPVGTDIRVSRVGLDVQFDASRGDDWTGTVVVEGLDQPGIAIDRLALDGSGVISGQGDSATVTAKLDFLAEGLRPDDGGLAGALGERATGRAGIDWQAGAPVRVQDLTLTGATYFLTGDATLDPAGENVPLSADFTLKAQDLSAFAALANRPLEGTLDARIDATTELLSGAFDVSLEGTGEELRAGMPEIDGLLSGTTSLALDADRDETGTRLSRLTLDSEAVDVDATADISSTGGSLDARVAIDDLARIDAQLDGPATLTLTGDNPGGQAWQFDLQGAGAGIGVDGTARITDLDAESPLADFDLQVRAEDLARFSGVARRQLGGSLDVATTGTARFDLSTADVSLNGTLDDLALGQSDLDRLLAGRTTMDAEMSKQGARIEVPRLEIANPQITAGGEGVYDAGNSRLTADVAMAELSRVLPSLQGPATLSMRVTDAPEGLDVTLTGNGAGVTLDGDATLSDLDTASPLAAGDVRAQVADLSVFSEVSGRDLNGSADLDVSGRTRFDLGSLDVTVDGTLTDIRLGQAELDRLLDGRTDIEGQVSKDGAAISSPGLSIANPQIEARAEGRYEVGSTDVTARVVLDELSQVVPSMAGRAAVDVEARDVAEGLQVTLAANGAGADVSGEGLVMDLGSPDQRAEGRLNVTAADLAAFSEIARRQLGGSVDLALQGAARFDLRDVSGEVDGTATDLRVGQADLDRLFAGTTSLSGQGSKAGQSLMLQGLALENPQVTVSAEGQYGTGDGAVQANVRFPDLARIVPAMSGPGTLALFADQVDDLWQVSADADGAGLMLDAMADVTGIGAGASPRVDGSVNLTAEDLSRFSSLANRALNGSVRVTVEGQAVVDGTAFDVTANGEAQRLAIGIPQVDQLLNGSTTVAADVSREGPDAPIRVQRFSLDAPMLDATADGAILGGSSGLDFNATLADLGVFVPGLNGPLRITGSAGEAGATAISLDIAADGPGGVTANVAGQIARTFDSADLSIDGRVPLALANPFLQPRLLEGTAVLDLGLNGPLALSSLSGQATVQGARFVDPTLPFVLNGFNLTARIANSSVRLSASASKQEGGTLQVSGPVSLEPGYAANLSILADRLVLEDPNLYRTSLDGTVTVNGPLTGGAVIAGNLRLGDTEIRIPSTGLGATGPIPDGLVHVNETAAERQTRQRAGLIEEDSGSPGGGGGGGGYPLDLTIVKENGIFVRGRGLDAELGGQLRLSGTTANVVPAGQFDLIRGRLDLLGQRLTLDEGSISLQGDFTPFVRLVARTEAGDVTILIVVEGAATSPDISFLSQPELPEDEVLSRLLFGKSIQDISALQAAQLASAVATLAGRGGDGVISKLRQNFGLDDLDITTDSEGNVGVRAGAYISENLYSDVTVDSDGEAEINLNLDLSKSLTVRGGASSGGDTSLGIFFERDY